MPPAFVLSQDQTLRTKNYFVADKFVCAFLLFKKLNSRSIQIFLIKTQQCLHHCLNLTRAIRTIQFFKEHRILQSAVFQSLHLLPERSNEFLTYHSFPIFQAGFERFFIFLSFGIFAFPDSPDSISSLMIIAVLRREV